MRSLRDAVELLELSHQKNMISQREVADLFRECCRNGDFELVDRIFVIARDSSFLNAKMLDEYMTAAFQANRGDRAKDELSRLSLAAPSIVDEENFIHFMRNASTIEEVVDAYSIGKAAIQAPSFFFYHCALHLANQANRYEHSKIIFEDAKKSKIADEIMYHTYLAGYGMNPHLNLERAMSIFNSIRHLVIVNDVKKDRPPQVDLHGFSHGSGKVALHHLNHDRYDLRTKPIVLICGQGREESGNCLTFRKSLIEYIHATWPKAIIDTRSQNLGQITVTFSPGTSSRR